ncbi:MAG: hypothetical protein AB1Z55_10235, partial [Acidimicrobiia bacterium]
MNVVLRFVKPFCGPPDPGSRYDAVDARSRGRGTRADPPVTDATGLDGRHHLPGPGRLSQRRGQRPQRP